MANLTDTNINGDLRVSGTVFGVQAGNYATCATAAGTAAKVITISGFTLTTGIHVFVKFTVTNTAAVASLTLNVSTTGAKAIKYRGGNLPAVGTLSASRVYEFVYDGTNWELVGDLDTFATLPLSVANGGTGVTSEQAIVNGPIQTGIGQGDSDVTDATELITTHATTGYNTTNKRLYRRKATYLWNYIKGKLTSVSGVNISGNAASASAAQSGSALETAINNKADKSSTVSNVAWDSTNKKLTKTINGSTSDVVTATTLKSAMSLNNVTNDAQVKRTEMGTANGVATLDANGVINTSQLPSYVDDVLEYSAKSQFPATGETGKIYVDTSTNLTWRWSGTTYVEISPSLALGETSSTAYRGDRGKTAYDHSQLTSGNPHHVTAEDVKAVRYDTNAQGLTDTQKSNARTNIGAGTSSLTIGTTATTAAAGNHAHGNITNGGALQTTDITIANGDKLVVTDASDSNKIARTSVAFDGTTTAKALTQKGTFETVMTPSEAMSLSGGDGVDVTIANNAATLSANISSIPTSVIEALS